MQRMPSSAAGSETASSRSDLLLHEPTLADPLLEAARALVGRGAFCGLWCDLDLIVVTTIGVVPGDPQPGMHVCDALIVLIGLEEEIVALRNATDLKPIRIPNASVTYGDGSQTQRYNIGVFWVEAKQQYLLILSTIIMHSLATDELDQEIRRRRLIEQDLAARSLEYARINQQLEEFAYVISHDLNAPLRALRYLSSDIEAAIERASPQLESKELAAVRDGATSIAFQTRRMSQMMTDLLEYARIGRVQEAIERVDTAAMVGIIVQSLRPTTELSLDVEGIWPEIETAVAPLDLVLRNLIENAVKHHDRAHGRIIISGEVTERHLVMRISDDGRGIPEEWHTAIFEPFRKVDDAHHPDSSGIGLALVKKTVVSMGGAIAVASNGQEQRGTTFVVHWPLRIAIPDDAAVDFH